VISIKEEVVDKDWLKIIHQLGTLPNVSVKKILKVVIYDCTMGW
jgi:hypothetical protein